MKWRERISVALAALVVALGVSVVAAQPAAAGVNDCLAGRYCVWTNQGFGGLPDYYWTIPAGSGGFCVNYGPGLNDQVDSNAIRGGRSATQYRNANCSGNTINTIVTAGDWNDECGGWGTAWACYFEGQGQYLPSSAWIIK